MNELSVQEIEYVSGGVIWAAAWAVVAYAIMATDASTTMGKGFDEGFEAQKEQSKQENGWG